MAQAVKERKIITDKLVLEKTGHVMENWFLLLDKKGARNMAHGEIFSLIGSITGLKPLGQWNQNLLTTTYEWNRGIKERGQKGKDFEISVSKTVSVPLNVLYKSFIDTQTRNKWLKEKITIRKSTENKSARITWGDGLSSLSVDFYGKAPDKSQVVVQHLKLLDSKRAAAMKTFWTEHLDALKLLLEK